jgi:predicted Holliday junction resolvase-like endonuclease
MTARSKVELSIRTFAERKHQEEGMYIAAVLFAVLITVLVLACLLIGVLLLAYRNKALTYNSKLEQLLSDHDRDVSEARKQSVNQSRHVLKGKITEQMAPLLSGFLYEAADARFIGDPIDYLVFNGYSKLSDKNEDDKQLEIVLLEIKQGSSALTTHQRAIASAFRAGKVRFEVCVVANDGQISTKEWPLKMPKPAKEII